MTTKKKGTATGIVSFIGFTPDIFMPAVAGSLLDKFPGGLGFRYFFLIVSGFCMLGLLASFIVSRKKLYERGGGCDC